MFYYDIIKKSSIYYGYFFLRVIPFAVQHVGHSHVDDEPDKVFGLPVRPYVTFLHVLHDAAGADDVPTDGPARKRG